MSVTLIKKGIELMSESVKKYDVIVLGGGPGGYIAAIRASQLGKKTALVEETALGGVCLNKGCIPTKALLKSAHFVHELQDAKELGVNLTVNSLDGTLAVKRAMSISSRIAKGVDYLMKKNKIDVFKAKGKFQASNNKQIHLSTKEVLQADFIIIATGAHYKTFPNLVHDHQRIIGAWQAVSLEKLPKSIGIIGAGAIGVEFAYFWNAFGVKVHIFERMSHLLPIEDEESSIEIEKAYKKYGISFDLGLSDVKVDNKGDFVEITSTDKNGLVQKFPFDLCLVAVGMTGNIENNGFEDINLVMEKGFIKVNSFQQTSVPHIYAIGDVSGPPLLAHAASHEGIIAAEHLSGKNPHPIDPLNIPGCTYCQPQVASVGYTERALKEKGIAYKVGKLPFVANGKAIASNEKEGFVKVLLGAKHGEILGAHIVGVNATELIHEYTLHRTMEGVDKDIISTVHPHPTLGEWLAQAVLAANNLATDF